MQKDIFVYDPTASDEMSRVRGVGRYLQILRENFKDQWIFDDRLSMIGHRVSVFINPFLNFLQPPVLKKRIAEKQIAVIHDLIPLKYPSHFPVGIKGKWNVFANKRALKHYDMIVTDSEVSKKDIIEILNVEEKKVTVIYPILPRIFTGSDVDSNKNIPPIPFQIPLKFCMYVGDGTWNKNLATIAKAVKLANVTCIFVGKVFKTATSGVDLSHPWQKELKDFFSEVRGDKRFIFPGFIPDEQMINLYVQSKCNILLSRDEGFGFSYLESASQACPSVLSDISVLRETAGDSALFTSPSDPTEAANKIEEYYFDESKRKIFSFRALERSKSFSSKNFKSGWGSALLP